MKAWWNRKRNRREKKLQDALAVLNDMYAPAKATNKPGSVLTYTPDPSKAFPQTTPTWIEPDAPEDYHWNHKPDVPEYGNFIRNDHSRCAGSDSGSSWDSGSSNDSGSSGDSGGGCSD